MRHLALFIALAVVGCGGDSTGPSNQNFAGSYPGEFYVISTSSQPTQRDSTNGGAVTLTLTSTGGESYAFSSTTSAGGSSGSININSAGVMSFPTFDETSSLNFLGSLTSGVCDLSNASVTPTGSVVSQRLSLTLLVSGGVCDYSQNGSDVRPTLLQLTWTGTKS
jgi:hypothetical protein